MPKIPNDWNEPIEETKVLLQRLMEFLMDVAEFSKKSIHISITVEPDDEKKKNDSLETADNSRVFVTMTVEPVSPYVDEAEDGDDG